MLIVAGEHLQHQRASSALRVNGGVVGSRGGIRRRLTCPVGFEPIRPQKLGGSAAVWCPGPPCIPVSPLPGSAGWPPAMTCPRGARAGRLILVARQSCVWLPRPQPQGFEFADSNRILLGNVILEEERPAVVRTPAGS
jgi:hypothetical protein